MEKQEMIDWLLSIWTTVLTMMNAKDDKKGRKIKRRLTKEGWKPKMKLGDFLDTLDEDEIEDMVDFFGWLGIKKPTGPYGTLNPENRKLIDRFDEMMKNSGIRKFIDEKYPEFLEIVLGRGNSQYVNAEAWLDSIRVSAMKRLVKKQGEKSEKEEEE